MSEEFGELLRNMSDDQINAMDIAALDDDARHRLIGEVERRNRENDIAEIEIAQHRGRMVSQGNRRWPVSLLAAILLIMLVAGAVWIPD